MTSDQDRGTALAQLFARIADLPEFSGRRVESVNDVGAFGSTPLHVVAVWGDLPAIQLLLDAGADINARGEHGYTPLHEAVEQGHHEAARLLVQRGASTTATNDDGVSPAGLAAALGDVAMSSIVSTGA